MVLEIDLHSLRDVPFCAEGTCSVSLHLSGEQMGPADWGHYHEFVECQVQSGHFKNASEVMRAGLRLLEQQTLEDHEKLTLLRSLAQEGFVHESEAGLTDFIASLGRRAAEASNG